jgi:hypothetical protein
MSETNPLLSEYVQPQASVMTLKLVYRPRRHFTDKEDAFVVIGIELDDINNVKN